MSLRKDLVLHYRMDDINPRSVAPNAFNEPSGLVAHWPLTDAAPNKDVADIIGGNDGEATQNTKNMSVDGHVWPRAIDFGSVDYIDADQSEAIDQNNKFSFAIWFKAVETSTQQCLFEDSEGGGEGFGLMLVSDELRTGMWTGAAYAFKASGAFTSTDWTHAVVTFDGTNMYLYIDGVRQTGTTDPFLGLSPQLTIGARSSHAWPFSGEMEDVRIYNRALTHYEVAQLYNRGDGIARSYYRTVGRPVAPRPTPVGWWKMNDNAATSTAVDAIGENDGEYQAGGVAQNTNTGSVAGKRGTALDFDGVNERVVIGDLGIGGNRPSTVSCWVKLDQVASVKGSHQTILNGIWQHTANDFLYIASTNDYFNLGGNLTAGVWHHMVLVFGLYGTEGSVMYLDGIRYDITLQTGPRDIDIFSSFNLGVTAAFGAVYLFGELDDVRVFDRELTHDQIIDVMNDNYLGLVAHWKCNDNAANTTVVESSNHGHTGTSQRNTNLMNAAGKINDCFDLDGINDYITVPDDVELDGWDEVTFAFWIDCTLGGASPYILDKDDADDHGYIFVYDETNDALIGLVYYGTGSSYVTVSTTAASLPHGSWTHLSIVIKRGCYWETYVNGVPDSRGDFPDYPVGKSTQDLIIGADTDGNNKYTGKLDDLRIYNRALSPDEISMLYFGDLGTEGYPEVGDGQGVNMTNAANVVNGIAGGLALEFNGSDEDIDCGDVQLSNIVGSLTISYWVKASNIGVGAILVRTVSRENSNYEMYIDEATGELYLVINASGISTGAGVVVNDVWQHHVGVFDLDNSLSHIYVDGDCVVSGACAVVPQGTSVNLHIANYPSLDRQFMGVIDEFTLWNRVLTASEVKTLYTLQRQGRF